MDGGFMRDLDGEDDDVAQVWMRDFTKYVTTATISVSAARVGEVKASVFAAHIAEGSEAQTWYQGLTQAQRDSWTNLVIQFNAKWPPRAAIPKTIKEHIEEFKACTLAPDEMLERIPTGVGTSMQWGYAAFADKIRRTGTKMSLPIAALLIDIKEQMPPVLVKLMIPHSNAVTWADWCNALKDLNHELIQSEQNVFERLSALEREAEAHRAQSESDRLRAAATPRPYTQRPPPPQQHFQQQQHFRPPLQPFASAPAPAYTSNQPPQSPPNTPNPFLATPPPKTPQNTARVEQERQEWAGRFPDRIPYASRAYPLTPGTASALVGCPRCGEPETASHNGFRCTNAPLEELEQRYRANVKRTSPQRLNAYATPARSYTGPATPSPMRGSPWRGRGGYNASPSPLHYVAAQHPQEHAHGYDFEVQQIEEEVEREESDAPHDEEPGNGGEVL
ncbi:hypothetical protein EXIGLDRAFT_840898 [Exidia glandulosa HHB12029]|uniref:Retrotransposon gag domain-containing protein n=1 Tax=Exidia glandulosa HHB12029 TaxID=1314781 RepID=A0A165E7Z1_EXIGL|nr:hypothetical protein EXIGLDRAFT_840898 [Exidia glandulosa HHB12029]